MKNLMMIALAVGTVGFLSACSSTDTARTDQAPYGYDRTVGATQKAPVHKADTVFHAKQAK